MEAITFINMGLLKNLKLNKYNKELLNLLEKKGYGDIRYCIENNLRGNACFDPKNRKIYFKNERNKNNQKIISHELLHAVMFVEGYQQMSSTWKEVENSVEILDNLFAHIIMAPRLEKIGCPLNEREVPAIKNQIKRIKKGEIQKLKELETDWDKKLLSSVVYIRTEINGIGPKGLKDLENYLKRNCLYDSSMIKRIKKNLPRVGCRKKDYKKLQIKFVNDFALGNDIIFLKFEKT